MLGQLKTHPVVSIVGAGNVGASAAATLAERRLAEVRLYDIIEGRAGGMAMDINQSSFVANANTEVIGCDQFSQLSGSDVVVIAAGAPRRAGMLRRDLLRENIDALGSISTDMMRFCPEAIVLIVTNPVEVLTWFTGQHCPEMRVAGLGCTLDTVRLRYYLARQAGVSVNSVSGIVIGSHDNNMVPLIGHATIGGARADGILSSEQIEAVVNDTRGSGAAIVEKLKTRGSYYAAAHCIADVVTAILRDAGEVFPLSISCQGQYGYDDTCLALPCRVGANGVDGIVMVDLDSSERTALDRCAALVNETMAEFRAVR